MRKTSLIVLSLSLLMLMTGTASAYSDCSVNPNCSISDEVLGIEQREGSRDSSAIIEAYKHVIQRINQKISDLSTPGGSSTTLTKLPCQKISQVLWQSNPNQSRSDVLTLQNFLGLKMQEWHVATDGDKDGVYGSNTVKWVKEFQKRSGLTQTGSVGPKTLAKINTLLCPISQDQCSPATQTWVCNNGACRCEGQI